MTAGYPRTSIRFNVSETNLDAQLFLKASAFFCAKTIRGEDEDGYRFIYRASVTL